MDKKGSKGRGMRRAEWSKERPMRSTGRPVLAKGLFEPSKRGCEWRLEVIFRRVRVQSAVTETPIRCYPTVIRKLLNGRPGPTKPGSWNYPIIDP